MCECAPHLLQMWEHSTARNTWCAWKCTMSMSTYTYDGRNGVLTRSYTMYIKWFMIYSASALPMRVVWHPRQSGCIIIPFRVVFRLDRSECCVARRVFSVPCHSNQQLLIPWGAGNGTSRSLFFWTFSRVRWARSGRQCRPWPGIEQIPKLPQLIRIEGDILPIDSYFVEFAQLWWLTTTTATDRGTIRKSNTTDDRHFFGVGMTATCPT